MDVTHIACLVLALAAGCNGARHPPPDRPAPASADDPDRGSLAGRPLDGVVEPSGAKRSEAEAAPSLPPTPPAGAGGTVAVVELFTSEGCSSCPPADDVLRRVRQGAGDEPIVLLAFHVDYWDDLGWPDRFATAAGTERQRAYARRLGERGVYTPELVVDGREAFVGSDAPRAARAIEAALARPGRARATVDASPDGDRRIAVSFSVRGVEGPAELLVALTEDGVSSRVTRGENAGKTLRHDAVVRAFDVAALHEPAGRLVIALPEDVVRARARAVVLVQRDPTREVLAAASTPIR